MIIIKRITIDFTKEQKNKENLLNEICIFNVDHVISICVKKNMEKEWNFDWNEILISDKI